MTQHNLAQENVFLTCCAKHFVDDKKRNNWRAFQKEGTPPMWCRDRLVDVQHILIEIAPNFETKSLAGTTTLTVSAINDGTETVELDASEMKIASVKVRGKPVHFHYDGQKLCVHFDTSPKADKPFDIKVEYSTTPRRGAYFVGPDASYPHKHREMWTQGQDEDSRYWFPCFDYPNEKATTEVIARVPKGMISLSNGKLVKVVKKSDHELHHWAQAIPHVAYLVTLVIGEYAKIKDSWDGIEASYYVPPGREEDGKRSFSRTPAMMKLFSDKTGVRYPYEKYSQITAVDFIFGGMENTTATTQTELTLHDARAHLDFKSDGLVAHELAHQWFGDYVTCRDWSHAWLNEGFATFMEKVWCEAEEGWAETQYYFERDMKAYLDEDSGAYRRPIVTNVYKEPLDLFDRHLYQKGSLVLHHLRATIGERLFWKSINHYLNKHGKGSVITQDLINAIQDVTGRNMEWFFDQWVFSGGHPDFKISAMWDDKTSQLELNVVQKQAKDELTAIFRVETKVRFVWEGGEEVRDFELSEAAHRYQVKLPKRPKMVLFDPGNTVLKTVELDYTEEMLIAQLKGDKDDVMGRVYAARELGKKGTIAATDALADALLKDPFWGVQVECAAALGKVHSDRALDALIEARQVKSPKARQGVALSLGQWRGDKAADALLPMLYRDDSYFVETAAASSLGRTRSTKAYAALIAALSKESYNDTIRSGVFSALCELRDMRALEVIRGWTAYGRSWQARLSAIAALGRLAHDSTEEKDKVMARETLEPLLEQDFRTTLSAIAGLQALGDVKGIAALEKCARASLDGRIKRRALDAAQAIRDNAGAPKELRELREDYDKIKKDYDDLKNRMLKLEGDKGPAKKHGKEKQSAKR